MISRVFNGTVDTFIRRPELILLGLVSALFSYFTTSLVQEFIADRILVFNRNVISNQWPLLIVVYLLHQFVLMLVSGIFMVAVSRIVVAWLRGERKSLRSGLAEAFVRRGLIIRYGVLIFLLGTILIFMLSIFSGNSLEGAALNTLFGQGTTVSSSYATSSVLLPALCCLLIVVGIGYLWLTLASLLAMQVIAQENITGVAALVRGWRLFRASWQVILALFGLSFFFLCTGMVFLLPRITEINTGRLQGDAWALAVVDELQIPLAIFSVVTTVFIYVFLAVWYEEARIKRDVPVSDGDIVLPPSDLNPA